MRGRSRRFRSRGRRSSRRKIRWLGTTGTLAADLQNSPAHGLEYVSFWLKWPASLETAASASPLPGGAPVAPYNEPVDDTLVRLRTTWAVLAGQTGATGNAAQGTFCFGIIPFDGGEYPDFWDFSVFQLGVSLVAPPNPIIDIDDSWVYRVGVSYLTEDPSFFGNTDGPESLIDVRSMRKLPAGWGLLGVVAVGNVLNEDTASTTVRFAVDCRMAVKSGYAL